MLIARAADRRPIAFERRLQDFQARGGREFHELGARIDEEIDERKMALAEGIDLIRPINCARLSLHGGFLLGGRSPSLVTGRIARPVRVRHFKFQQRPAQPPFPKQMFLATREGDDDGYYVPLLKGPGFGNSA